MKKLIFGIIVLLQCIQGWALTKDAFFQRWIVIGPYVSSDTNRLDIDWLKDMGGEEYLSRTDSSIDSIVFFRNVIAPSNGYVDFNNAFSYMENAVAYARTDVQAERSGGALLKLGSDDGVKVWVNGKCVFTHKLLRGAIPDQDEVFLPLNKGTNRILFKVDQADQGWGLYARIGEYWEQKEGRHLVEAKQPVLPFILTGSKFPLNQSIDILLLNDGTTSFQNPSIKLSSPQLKEFIYQVSGVLIPLSIATVHLLLAPQPGLKSLDNIVININAQSEHEPIGYTLSSLTTSARRAHLLLTGALDSDDTITRVVHITDTHIISMDKTVDGIPTAKNLKDIVEQINSLKPLPDFVVVSGDILLDNFEGFGIFKSIMNGLKVPLVCSFGNHDKPKGQAESAKVFSQWGYSPYFGFDYHGNHFIILDSVIEPESDAKGALSQEELKWLEEDLKQNKGKLTFLFSHHNFFSKYGAENYKEVMTLLQKYPDVKWSFSGHLHDDFFVTDSLGIHHIITPATSYLFSGISTRYSHNTSGFRLITIRGNEVTTEFAPLHGILSPDIPVSKYQTPVQAINDMPISRRKE